MFLGGLLLAVIASATPTAGTIAVLPFATSPERDEVANFAAARIAQLLQERGRKVVTPQDAMVRLGDLRPKLNCTTAQCVSEIATALGADIVVRGEVTEKGAGVEVWAEAIDAATQQRLATASAVAKNESANKEAVESVATSIRAQLLNEPKPTRSLGRAAVWIPAALGVGLLAAGGALYGVADGQVGDLTRAPRVGEAPLMYSDAANRFANAQALSTTGITLMALGGASLGVAAAVYFSLPVVIVPTAVPGLTGVTISWRMP